MAVIKFEIYGIITSFDTEQHVTNNHKLSNYLNSFKAFCQMFIFVSCSIRDRTKEWHLSLSSVDVVKGDWRNNSTAPWDRLQSDGDGLRLTTCHVCSISHTWVILVKRGGLGGISEMPLLLLCGWSVNGMYVIEKIWQFRVGFAMLLSIT
jgi:hypothetical protein